MLGGRGSTIIFYGAVAFCAVLFAIYWLEMFAGWDGWCAPAESVEACRREWFGAAAGWAAAFAAGGTIIVLIRQLHEVRRQNVHLIGDSEPTVQLYGGPELSNGHPANVLRIVNWNRNRVLVTDLRVVTEGVSVAVIHRRDLTGDLDFFGENVLADARAGRLWIPGWESRQEPPADLRMQIAVARAPSTAKPKGRIAVEPLEIEVTIRIVDDRAREVRKRAMRPDASIYYSSHPDSFSA